MPGSKETIKAGHVIAIYKALGIPLRLREVVAAHIERVMDATGGNKKAAAEALGIDRRSLQRRENRTRTRRKRCRR